MHLPLLPPSTLSPEQRDLYDDVMGVIKKNFGELMTSRKDGALIGPWNAWLHFRSSASPPGRSTRRCMSTALCLPRSTRLSSW